MTVLGIYRTELSFECKLNFFSFCDCNYQNSGVGKNILLIQEV